MPDGRRALSVKKGDVLGLYIEDAQGTDGSFQVHYQKNVTNSMIYAYKVDMALEHIELSMAASSVLMDAAPVLTVLLGESWTREGKGVYTRGGLHLRSRQ